MQVAFGQVDKRQFKLGRVKKRHFKKFEGTFFLPVYQALRLSCDSRFQRAFTTCSCVFKANQRNFFENATTCSKRMRKTLVATQLKIQKRVSRIWTSYICLWRFKAQANLPY